MAHLALDWIKILDNPNRFRLQAMYSSWAAVDRLDRRITRDEHALWSELWTLHIGTDSPSPKRHLGIQHWIPEESAMSRLKPVPTPTAPKDQPAAESSTQLETVGVRKEA